MNPSGMSAGGGRPAPGASADRLPRLTVAGRLGAAGDHRDGVRGGSSTRPAKRHVVRLTDDQRAELEGRFCGRLTLRERNRVQVLLRSDGGDTDDEIAEALGICVATVVSVRKRFAAEGLEAALGERPRSGGPATFDGKVEAAVVALAC